MSKHREKVQALLKKTLNKLHEQELLLYARHQVFLATETIVGQNKLAGIPGEATVTKTEILPPPMVDISSQFKSEENVIQKFGEARVSRILQSEYLREDLEGADFFLIDDSPYTLVEGSVHQDKAGVFFDITLVRQRQNDHDSV